MLVRIMEVDTIKFDSHSTTSSKTVNATGRVSSSGWSGFELGLLPNPPSDKRLHLEFLGIKPEGYVNPVIMPATAQRKIDPSGYIGVVVYATNGEIKQDF